VMMLQALVVLGGVKFLMPAPAPASTATLSAEDGAEHGDGAGDAAHGDAAATDGHGAAKDAHGDAAKDPKAATKKTYEPKKHYELKLIELKAPNKQSGRTYVYDLKIVVMVKGKVAEEVEKTISEREALIQDRLRTIIAQSDPEKLGGGSEPGLETLRRQVKYQLDEIIGEARIDEVLVPRCNPFRTDF